VVAAWHIKPAKKAIGLILFAHGAGNDGLFPQGHLFKELVDNDYEIFTFDLDGHGVGSTTWMQVETMTSALINAATIAKELSPKLPMHLIGYSLGGALALHAVANHNEIKFDSLCLLATPWHLNLTPLAMLTELTSFWRSSLLKQISFYGLYGILPAAGHFKRRSFPLRLPPSSKGAHPPSFSGLEYTQHLKTLFSSLDLQKNASLVGMRTLLIYGAKDQIAPVAQAVKLRSSLPNATLLVLPNDTHYTTILSTQTLTAIKNFLKAKT
jgi:pimeloyl-ACP methyl ester carboxylesterase